MRPMKKLWMACCRQARSPLVDPLQLLRSSGSRKLCSRRRVEKRKDGLAQSTAAGQPEVIYIPSADAARLG